MMNNFNQLEDFIGDDSFLSYAYKKNKKDIDHWNNWITQNPDKKTMVTEAENFLLQIQLQESPVNNQQQASAEARLMFAIEAGKINKPAKVTSINRRKIWYAAAAAAVITGVIALCLNILFDNSLKPQLATAYGQVSQNKLPDGTDVILNANSKLTYPKKWKEGTAREVWIKGEAFFHVKKTALHNKFIVHTDAFDIEVTGTSFDVINRKGISSIVLKEGSVKIHQPGKAEFVMKPGDFVEFADKQLQKSTMIKQDYLAWTESKLVFDNSSLEELAEIIQEHYGLAVLLKGDGLSNKTITGIMPNDSLEVLLQSLEATQDFLIQRTGTTITITNKANN